MKSLQMIQRAKKKTVTSSNAQNQVSTDEPYFYDVNGVTWVRHDGYEGPYNTQGEAQPEAFIYDNDSYYYDENPEIIYEEEIVYIYDAVTGEKWFAEENDTEY